MLIESEKSAGESFDPVSVYGMAQDLFRHNKTKSHMVKAVGSCQDCKIWGGCFDRTVEYEFVVMGSYKTQLPLKA